MESRSAAAVGLTEAMYCVVDVETTGLSSVVDRIVEIAVIRCDARGRALDEWHTLIDPGEPVDATWIHGIDDAMLVGAPCFADIAPLLLASLSEAVLVGHNAAFDRGFLIAELQRAGVAVRPPHLCTMQLRRRVGLPAPTSHRLAWACWHAAVPIDGAHTALSDAHATVALLATYLQKASAAGCSSVGDLARNAALAQSCAEPLLRAAGTAPAIRLHPRRGQVPASSRPLRTHLDGIAAYAQAVAGAVADLELDGDEVDELHGLVLELGLDAAQIADAHRRFIRDRLNGYLDDDELTWEELEQLRILGRLLAVDGAWLEELVAPVKPVHAALTLDPANAGDVAEAEHVDLINAPLTVCFTGEFVAMPLTRTEAQALATDAGMQVKSGVSGKLDMLVCLDPHAGTGKLRKAEQQGTVVIDQLTFLAVAGVRAGTPGETSQLLAVIVSRRRARQASRPTRRPAPTLAAEPPRVVAYTALSSAEQILWCEKGGHGWSRPSRRGRPPKHCPGHP